MSINEKARVVDIEEKVQILLRQTDYTEEKAREKLTFHDFDEVKCIKEYLGIDTKEKNTKITKANLNQQIYKEIRATMGGNESASLTQAPLIFRVRDIVSTPSDQIIVLVSSHASTSRARRIRRTSAAFRFKRCRFKHVQLSFA